MQRLFDDVIGHEQISQVLGRAARHPGQAYLFQGPAQVGKRMVAERFAALLLFTAEELASLQTSRDLLTQRLLAHPDFILFGRTTDAKEITVKQTRELLQRLAMSSARGGKIVVLIDGADQLNEESANALLKSVEEPSSALVFVFIAERPDRLPATLRSRLIPLMFHRVANTKLADWLTTTQHMPDPTAIVRAARGCPGRALTILAHLAMWQAQQAKLRGIVEQLLHGDLGTRLTAIERLTQLAEQGEDVEHSWQELLEACERLIEQEWLNHPLETLRMARGLIHAWRLVGGSLSPRFALEWNGTLPFVATHSIPRSLDSSFLFSL